MISRKSVTWTVSKLISQIDRKKISFDNEIQRAVVWNAYQKSLFIHSILMDMPIPPLYAIQDSDKIIDIIDGKQRATTLESFLYGKFKLKGISDVIQDDGSLFTLNGKRYNDLSDELKENFNNYNISLTILENAKKDEVEEVFFRLNNGTALKNSDKNFAKALSKDMIIDLCGHELFKEVFKEDALARMPQKSIVIHSFMIMNENYDLDSKNMQSFLKTHKINDSEKNQLSLIYDRILSISKSVKEDYNYSQNVRNRIIKALLSKTSIPSLIPLVKSVNDDDKLLKFCEYFFCGSSKRTVSDTYNNASGAGSWHRVNVETRINNLKEEYDKYELR